jgi:hypothetical protein
MAEMITLVAPDAPMPAADELTAKSKISQRSIRFGLLDNSKGNADHLLNFVVAGVKRVIPLASVVALRKDNAAKAAPSRILDQLAAEADFVVSAMAD